VRSVSWLLWLLIEREGRKEGKFAPQIHNTARQILETVRNWTHVHINFFLRMTDTVTSQNIELSSWDTLYMWGHQLLWFKYLSSLYLHNIIGGLYLLERSDMYETPCSFITPTSFFNSLWHFVLNCTVVDPNCSFKLSGFSVSRALGLRVPIPLESWMLLCLGRGLSNDCPLSEQ
jgi:hypothetical protein